MNKKEQQQSVKVNVAFDESTGFVAMSLFINEDWTVIWMTEASASELQRQVGEALKEMKGKSIVN